MTAEPDALRTAGRSDLRYVIKGGSLRTSSGGTQPVTSRKNTWSVAGDIADILALLDSPGCGSMLPLLLVPQRDSAASFGSAERVAVEIVQSTSLTNTGRRSTFLDPAAAGSQST